MLKRLTVRLILGALLGAASAVAAFVLHLLLASGIEGIPENRERIPFLPGEGDSVWLVGVTLIAGWAILSYAVGKDIGPWRWRRAFYLGGFVVLLGISVLNYAHLDMLINKLGQALLNLVLVFLGMTLLIELSRSQPESSDGVALRLIGVFLLCFAAVLVPGLFSLLWFLSLVGLRDISGRLSDQWIVVVAALASAVITRKLLQRPDIAVNA